MVRFSKIIILLFVVGSLFQIFAQISDLNPEQTVNPATGEMQFSLPLGIVQGVNGKDFPVNLIYKAGVRYDQEASPAGLGFNYGAGSITKKIVHVPDNNINGTFYEEIMNNQSCIYPYWVRVLSALAIVGGIVIGLVITIFSAGAGAEGAAAIVVSIVSMVTSNLTSQVLTGIATAITLLYVSSLDFTAGGTHLQSYDYLIDSEDDETGGDGTGYLYGGESYDLPDLYFVNTPLFSGQIFLVGIDDDENPKFVMQRYSGKIESQDTNIKIVYDKSAETFSILLNDGTELFFGLARKDNWASIASTIDEDDGTRCKYDMSTIQKEPVAVEWYLTKIKHPSYKDSNSNGVVDKEDSGAWLSFEYNKDVFENVVRLPFLKQTGRNSTMLNFSGTARVHSYQEVDCGYQYVQQVGNICYSANLSEEIIATHDLEDIYISKIVSPVETATFNYDASDFRKDDLWFSADKVYAYMDVRYTDDQVTAYTTQVTHGNSDQTIYKPRCDCGNDNYATPIQRKKLQSISFISNTGVEKGKVNFNTEYSLRPNSKYAMTVNGVGSLLPLPGNNEKASLTLKSIEFESAGKKLPPITFHYETNNPDGFSFKFGNRAKGSKRIGFWIEDKDYWGYYCPNIDNDGSDGWENDFNMHNLKTRVINPIDQTPYAQAWSLKTLSFPTGKTITWNYDVNKFYYSNSSKNDLQYGSGIRVKNISAKNNNGITSKTAYFYTNSQSLFEENELNSSGFLTVAPYPYIEKFENDIRPQNSRGGYYTPVKVIYDNVKIVDNWSAKSHKFTPTGYREFQFTSPNEYPNKGLYGEIDMSWKCGYIKKKFVYGKDFTLLNKTSIEYDFIENPYPFNKIKVQENTNPNQYSFGIARKRNTVENQMGIVSKKEFTYAAPDDDDYYSEVRDVLHTFISHSISTEGADISSLKSITCSSIGDKNKTDVITAALLNTTRTEYNEPPTLSSTKLMIWVYPDLDAGEEIQEGRWIGPISFTNSFPDNISSNCNPYSQQTASIDYRPNLVRISNIGLCENDLVIEMYLDYGVRLPSGCGTLTNELKNITISDIGVLNSTLTYSNSPTLIDGLSSCLNTLASDPSTTISWEGEVKFSQNLSSTNSNEEITILLKGDEVADTLLGIYKSTKTVSGDYDNKPNSIKEESGGCHWSLKVSPAYLSNTGMREKNMLVQPINSLKSNSTIGFPLTNIVSATHTNWDNTITGAEGIFLPRDNYVWKEKLNANGLPVALFSEYEQSSPKWVTSNRLLAVNKNMQPIEILDYPENDNLKKFNTNIYDLYYRNIATISNARNGECIYTSFEDWDETYALSQFTGTSTLETADPITGVPSGTKYIKISTNAAVTSFTPVNPKGDLLEGKTFIFEFWAKSGDATSVTSVAQLQLKNNSKLFSSSIFTCANNWQKYRFPITFSSTGTEKQFRAVLNDAFEDGKTICFDGIRVYPVGAMMTNNTYDEYGRIIASTDNNNNITKVKYDEFGRTIETYNQDWEIISETEYHLHDELLPGEKIKLLSYSKGEDVLVGETIVIRWVNDVARANKIYYADGDGTDKTLIGEVTSNKFGSIVWDVPMIAANNIGRDHGERLIIIEDGNDANINDKSDMPFVIDGVRMLYPNGKEEIVPGEGTTIVFEAPYTVSDVDLLYQIEDEPSTFFAQDVIIDKGNNVYTFTWDAVELASYADGTKFKLAVVAVAVNAFTGDFSDDFCTLKK